MRIAIIGAGISGLTSAYLLNREHDVTVFESNSVIGGHTATKDVYWQGKQYAIDTGFIVFNDWTYPLFNRLLDQLGVEHQPTDMGFSVADNELGIEYSGASIATLFAQKRNLFSLAHLRMLKDILRFNKESVVDVEHGLVSDDMTLGRYLNEKGYSARFISHYLVPMGAAIWSSSTREVQEFPLVFFVNFFKNHGLLSVNNRPQWSVVKGGSRSYLSPLIESFKHQVFCSTPVVGINRSNEGVMVTTAGGNAQLFDKIVVATHSDQALALLDDPSELEQSVLENMGYRYNQVVLHTDDSILPKRRNTWSSWNYRLKSDNGLPVLTYNMNILQGIDAPVTFCVTLNDKDAIDPSKLIGTYQYAHPVFSSAMIKSQARWEEINGVNHTWFCGAYWGNGFHEDGVASALRVAKAFSIDL